MYSKDLSESVRLRLSSKDMDFLKDLSSKRGLTVSGCIRSIIGEYRRSLDNVTLLNEAIQYLKDRDAREAVQYGDTKTDIDDKL